ncbi:hypothetical protein, partial [Deinococcus phoenicis]|uniref:hypothetical protein n=1 Tax=Deinococcus phoenicis TaxID=1476583 RepID=UPI0005588D6A
MTIKQISIELQNAVSTDGITITGDGTESNPLTAHLAGDGAGLPEGGTPGQVLTRTPGGYGWATPPL